MPRRKQDRPKRMKWEEGDHNDRQSSSPDGEVVSAQSASGSDADEESDTENKRRKVQDYDSSPERASPNRKIDTPAGGDQESCYSPVGGTDSEPLDEGKMTASLAAASQSPETSIPLDFSVKKYNVLDLTSKCELNNHEGNDSCPLDLSVPRSNRSNAEHYLDDNKKSRKVTGHIPPAPKRPWGYSSVHKNPENRSDGYWEGKDSLKVLQAMDGHRRAGNDANFAQNRSNIWQTQWLTKGGEEINKDVLKCVWCKESFHSLSELTVHMKKSPRCGVSVPRTVSPVTSSPSSNFNKSSSAGGSGGSNSLNDLNMLIKETMPLPRKLVRGQDVWLGKGAEQTKQILKCMWCGQSFRSLAEMTTHMRQTQHYTNIISQEQLISWKSPEDKGSENLVGGSGNPAVNAVLTCKVCDQAFSSLKELSNHMGKNAHYQEHLFRAISEGGTRRRPVREKRKKALPVKKLLEMERSQHKKSPTESDSSVTNSKQLQMSLGGGRITCEKCSIKIDTSVFVEHIRTCVGKPSDGRKGKGGEETTGSDRSDAQSPVVKVERESPTSIVDPGGESEEAGKSDKKGKNPSVLNAIERLIEKSFDSAAKKPSVTSAFILRKMGFDENAFETRNKSPNDRKRLHVRSSISPHGDSAISRPSSRDTPAELSSEEDIVQRLKPPRLQPSSSDNSDVSSIDRKVNHVVPPPLAKDTKICREKMKSRRKRRKRERREERAKVIRENVVSSIGEEADDDDGGVEDKTTEEQPAQLPLGTLSPTEDAKSTDNGAKVEDGYFNDDKAKCDKSSETGSVFSDVNIDNACDNRSDGALSADDEHFLSESDDRPSSANADRGQHKVKTRKRLAKTIRDRQYRHNGSNDHRSSPNATSVKSSAPSSAHHDSSVSPPSNRRGPHGSDHPLKQLQKLLDKTDAQLFSKRGYNNKMAANFSGVVPGSGSNNHAAATSPFMASFGWAYNDALTYDTISKASFGDISYGGFTPPPNSSGVNNQFRSEQLNGMSKTGSPERPSKYGINNNNNNSNNNNIVNNSVSSTNGSLKEDGGSSTTGKVYEESPHSKFLKYSELAKQLSSK